MHQGGGSPEVRHLCENGKLAKISQNYQVCCLAVASGVQALGGHRAGDHAHGVVGQKHRSALRQEDNLPGALLVRAEDKSEVDSY